MASQIINKLAWVDLEMTGLDLYKHKIIEVAAIITDTDLNILDEDGFREVIHINRSEENIMEEVVLDMHRENGLLEEAYASAKTLEEVEAELIAYISYYFDRNTAPLCGNSISTDRAFIMAQMPRVEGYLSYRNIDVTTVKQLIQINGLDIRYEKPESTHRALDDIKESINQLKYYTGELFK